MHQVTRRSRKRRSRDRSWIGDIIGNMVDAIVSIWRS